MKCKIILLPPIIEFNGNPVKGVHENTDISKILSYRKDILNRLAKCAEAHTDIDLIDWNIIIKKHGINKIVKDQFHFTEIGKKIISQEIFKHIKSNLEN